MRNVSIMNNGRQFASRFFILFMTVYLAAQPVQAQDIPAELIHYPEFVFHNGQVLTADADKDFTVAEAVAVRGNRIFAVGTNAQIRRLAGPKTRVIDLKGRSLTPGFIYNDADNAVPAGDILKNSMWDGLIQPAIGGKTIDEALATMAALVESKGKPGEPLFLDLQDVWTGTAMHIWDKEVLDEIAPNVPLIVYLESSEGVLNSAMIELALKRGFPPNHIHLQRDKDGDPTGKAGAQLVGFIGREIRPWPEPVWFDDVAIPEAIASLTDYARNGITVATGHMSAPTITVLNRLFHEQPQNLKMRVYPGLDFLRQNPFGEMYLKRMGNLVDFSLIDERGEMVTIVGASVGPHSGTPDGLSGILSIHPKKNIIKGLNPNPKGDNRWSGEWVNGLSWDEMTPEQQAMTDYQNVILARQHGWNVTGIHNMGSEGIRLAMQNIVEAEAQEKKYVKNLWRPHGFDHNIEWVPEIFEYYAAHPELKQKNLIRFAITLGSGLNQRSSEPLGIARLTEAQWGMEGLLRMAPLKTLQDKGIPFHIEGSGASSPMKKIHQAVTRLDRDGRVIGADQALSRESAFLALTRWPARFIGANNVMGSIEVGHLADLVVFDGNIMDVPIEKLPALNPVLTLVGGKVAFEAPGL